MRYRAKLYASDGVSLAYTFDTVQDTNLPRASSKKSLIMETVRSKGCIVIDGGDDYWELTLDCTLSAANYEAIIAAIDALETAVTLQTAFVLKFDKTSTTTYSYNVKRINEIEWLGVREDKRLYIQKYRITFLANSW